MDLEADERLDEALTPPEAPNPVNIAGILGNIGAPSFHSPAKVVLVEPRVVTSPPPAYTVRCCRFIALRWPFCCIVQCFLRVGCPYFDDSRRCLTHGP
jgi:hypothetical protein